MTEVELKSAIYFGSGLPQALIQKHEHDAFWRDPARNPNKVRVI